MIGEVQTELMGLDERLIALQSQAARAKEVLPAALPWLSLLVTLFFAWVAYTQLLVIRQAWSTLHFENKLASPVEETDAH